ncbi:hypothetical protein BV20DRAFT_181023 [Pilatotrama ljubarskyi]|nr:hypothetical protein BV20DRAFT_181023 [Pilatotrama ljubarskyi]
MGDSETSSSSPSPVDGDHPSRSRSSSEQPRKRRSKDAAHMFSGSMRDVARVLVSRERDTIDLKRTLYTLRDQLNAERQRADAAENKTREVLALFKAANEAKIVAEQEAARTNEGLRLYKLQYENAQQEIRRAQELIDTLDEQRLEAEQAAATARSTARKMREEAIILSAREAGRREGLQEGLAQGRVLGYEEGRAAGYEDGRADTERAYTTGAMTEPYTEETPRQRYQPPRVSRPSTSEDSEANLGPSYTQPMDDTLPIPPPVTTPARMPTPAAAGPAMPRAEHIPRDPEVRPATVHSAMMSPSHPPVDVPPDGWIPKIDDDMRIRLPPPHEMGPPPPATPSPPLSAVLNNVRNIEEPPPVVIPPPATGPDLRMPEPHPSNAPRRPRHRRRNSDESQSTTMSQFEILGPPSSHGTLRGTVRERPPVLSAIAEERERTSSVSSPVYGMSNMSAQSFHMPSPAPQMPTPSPNMSMPSPHPHPHPHPHPPPANPTYTTPESVSRYRSTESLSRSDVPDSRYAPPETRSRSRASSTEEPRRYGDDYYRSRQGDHTPRHPSAENLYRPPVPDATPRYERPDSRSQPDYRSPYGAPDGASRSGSVGGYPSRDNLTRANSRSDLGRRTSVDDMSRTRNIYAPPRSPHSSPESPAMVAPAPTLRPPPAQPEPNRGSMSSNEISFTVVPPSRPESNISRNETEAHGSFLSADDADRPLPPLPSDGGPDTTGQPAAPANPVIPPPVMLSGPVLPPGFIPTGPPSPSIPGAPPSIYGGSSVGPVGVPLPPSTIGGTPSVRSEVPIPGSFPIAGEGPPPVIPLQTSTRSTQSSSSQRAREPYSRSALTRRDTDSDSSVSSGMGSADSLTTPPARTRKLSGRSGRSTPSYVPAPLSANIVYPTVPPTPRSTTSASLGSQTTRAARVPLPASVAGSAVGSVVTPPASTAGYPTAPTAVNRRSSVIGGGRTPSETSRPRSPMMGDGRNLSSPNRMSTTLPVAEPVIPIPIPEPQPALPVAQIFPMPSSPAVRAGTLDGLDDFDAVPIVPAVARAPSPGASTMSAATTVGAKGKKGKKKGGKGK